MLHSYGIDVIYAVRRWPKRRYAAHVCNQKVDSSVLCRVTGCPGWNFSWSSSSNNYLEVDKKKSSFHIPTYVPFVWLCALSIWLFFVSVTNCFLCAVCADTAARHCVLCAVRHEAKEKVEHRSWSL